MKLFADISIYVLLLAGLVLLILPVSWFPSFYDVRYMGFASLIGAAAISILPLFLRVSTNTPNAETKNYAADLFKFLLTAIIISNALGDLGLYQLYKIGFEFDKIIHLSTSLLSVLIIPIILRNRFEIRIPYAIAIAFITVLISNISWEVYERVIDFAWKTHISGVYGLNIDNDTKFDLIFDILGVICGTLISISRLIYKKRLP